MFRASLILCLVVPFWIPSQACAQVKVNIPARFADGRLGEIEATGKQIRIIKPAPHPKDGEIPKDDEVTTITSPGKGDILELGFSTDGKLLAALTAATKAEKASILFWDWEKDELKGKKIEIDDTKDVDLFGFWDKKGEHLDKVILLFYKDKKKNKAFNVETGKPVELSVLRGDQAREQKN